MAYGWDKAGNRTRVTWPDTSFYVDYEYDPLNRVSKIKEKGGSSGAPLLAVFGYDDLGRRTGLTRGNGTTTGWGWDTADRLTSLAHDPASTAYDQAWGYSYNPASQVIGRTAGNALYDWTNRPAGTVTKSYDGLNRDAGLASLGDGYDLNGNVIHDARQLYGYDIENRLVSVADAGTSAPVLSLAYDPLGRLRSQTASGVTTQFLYDGDRLAAEYNSGGTLTARYVHGAGVDEPLVWYGDSGVGLRRHLYSDAQGSVVARSGEAAGSVAKVYAYGPYGEPQAWDDSRFAYTGQIELREAGLYYYKARVYDPSVGRFLQTDPVGYEADLNAYAYVGGSPMNRSDPSGLKTYDCTSSGGGCPGTIKLSELKRGDVVKTDGATITLVGGQRGTVKLDVVLNKGFENGRSAAENGPILIPPAPPGVDLSENIRMSQQHSNLPLWFFHQVKNKGPMDYKQRGSKYEPFGNFNYGAVGAANHFFSPTQIQQGAGWAQFHAGTSDESWGSPPGGMNWPLAVIFSQDGSGGAGSYGDDPRDQYWMTQGMRYFDVTPKY